MNNDLGIPSEITREESNWATFCHLAGFAIFILPPFGHVIAPLILWLLKRHDSSFIDEQGKEAVNFQLSVSIYSIFCGLLLLFIIGLPLLMLLFIFWAFCTIYASIQANDGISYRYPLIIRII